MGTSLKQAKVLTVNWKLNFTSGRRTDPPLKMSSYVQPFSIIFPWEWWLQPSLPQDIIGRDSTRNLKLAFILHLRNLSISTVVVIDEYHSFYQS